MILRVTKGVAPNLYDTFDTPLQNIWIDILSPSASATLGGVTVYDLYICLATRIKISSSWSLRFVESHPWGAQMV